MVQTAPPVEPTIHEALAWKLLDRTVSCGGRSLTNTGPRPVDLLGTPKFTEILPVVTRSLSTEPVVLVAMVSNAPIGGTDNT